MIFKNKLRIKIEISFGRKWSRYAKFQTNTHYCYKQTPNYFIEHLKIIYWSFLKIKQVLKCD